MKKLGNKAKICEAALQHYFLSTAQECESWKREVTIHKEKINLNMWFGTQVSMRVKLWGIPTVFVEIKMKEDGEVGRLLAQNMKEDWGKYSNIIIIHNLCSKPPYVDSDLQRIEIYRITPSLTKTLDIWRSWEKDRGTI